MKRVRVVAQAMAVLLWVIPCLGKGESSDLVRAKTYFNAGAQAYAVGKYDVAIQAFEEAYKLAPRPAILFSMAQAERRTYFAQRKPHHIKRAIDLYRKYIAAVKQGGRRSDAVEALGELELLAARLYPDLESADVPRPTVSETRLMVTSASKGTKVSLNDGPLKPAPLIAELKPGKHRVRIQAPGHHPEEREVMAVKNELVALDIPLREMAARLNVLAASGARVHIDGRLVGSTPLVQPVQLPPGDHVVAVTKSGFVTRALEAKVPSGETATIRVPLEPTSQRIISWVVLGTGAAGLVTGGVFVGFALDREKKAQDIHDEIGAGGSSPERIVAYQEAEDDRNRWRSGAAIALGAGAALGLVGGLLYLFDRPTPVQTLPKSSQAKWNLRPAPWWGNNHAGGGLTGTF